MSVEQPARPAESDELAKHPAATFGKRAQLAGWRVEYRVARGPLTVRRRPAEPNEHGKYALVSVVETVDTLGVRAAHPDGRRLAAWWVGRAFGEGWAASPRHNAAPLGIRALTSYLTEIEIVEEETVNEEQEQGPVSALAEKSRASFEEWHTARRPSFPEDDREACELVAESYVAGYVAARAHASEEAGDAYGEGYAAGLAALTNHAQAWVKTQRRLDALRPGDVILGKGDRWWIVASTGGPRGNQAAVTATSGDEEVTVAGDKARKIDVVEPIATADALAALRELGAEPIAGEGAVA